MAVPCAVLERRRTEVVELAAAGHSFDDIAERLGYANRSGPYRLYRKVLADRQDDAVAEHRALEMQRLDSLQAGLWDRAVDGDVQAALAILKIIEQRCRLLGLEQPSRATRKASAGPRSSVAPGHEEEYAAALAETQEGNHGDVREGEKLLLRASLRALAARWPRLEGMTTRPARMPVCRRRGPSAGMTLATCQSVLGRWSG
jgi:hypothetical protein